MQVVILGALVTAAGLAPQEGSGDGAPGAFEVPAEELRERIAEARRLGEAYGESIWPGWDEAPFGLLLVEEEQETLFCHGGPVDGFVPLGEDLATACEMQARAAEFPPNLQAAFPAVAGVSTIVIGTPEGTGLDPLQWVVTVLHEHVHQMQTALPGYYEKVEALELSGDDKTGRWMLEYPFPYEREDTASAFAALTEALEEALEARGTDGFESALARYLERREALRATVPAPDWRYLEFQLWQEGVARWTEMALSGAAGVEREELAEHAREMRKALRNQLEAVRREGLGTWKRSALYAVGAGEALLLEAARPGWRERYLAEPFALGPYFEKAQASRGPQAGGRGS